MDILTLALAKKYTDNSLVGVGAIKGSPCTIKSITPTYSEKDPSIVIKNTIVFEWTTSDDETLSQSLVVDNGRGIYDFAFDHTDTTSNYFKVTYLDGSYDVFAFPKGFTPEEAAKYGLNGSGSVGQVLTKTSNGAYWSTPIQIDSTLKKQGFAADAKAAGDAVNSAISKEVIDRNAAVQDAIVAEASERNAAIAEETSAREAALTAEAMARTTAIAGMKASIDADLDQLSTGFTDEESARILNDNDIRSELLETTNKANSNAAQIAAMVGGWEPSEDNEVAMARIGSDGTSYNSLKARIDGEVDNWNDSIATALEVSQYLS